VTGGLMQHYATYGMLFDREIDFNINLRSRLSGGLNPLSIYVREKNEYISREAHWL
jgi:hypothetical protein